jgi:hypothetical protein
MQNCDLSDEKENYECPYCSSLSKVCRQFKFERAKNQTIRFVDALSNIISFIEKKFEVN